MVLAEVSAPIRDVKFVGASSLEGPGTFVIADTQSEPADGIRVVGGRSGSVDITLTHPTAAANLGLDPIQMDLERPRVEAPIPSLKHPLRPSPHLTQNVLKLSKVLWAIVVSKALQSGFPISRGVLDVESDPEEGTARPVLRVYTMASAVQAIAFWDSLSIELDKWLLNQRFSDRRVVMQDLGLRFHWAVNV